jgi:hypothetical protein
MAKENRPKEKMRLTIEFADNGIILRNPELEDEVTLALTKGEWTDSIDHGDEYKVIGKKVYDWLMDVVVEGHAHELICTGAELDIMATLTGREHEF